MFADAINGGGFHHGKLWRVHTRGCRAKYRDRAGPEDPFQFHFTGEVEDSEEASHVDIPGLERDTLGIAA